MGKNSYISRISNSVTHLRRYTNTAMESPSIARNAALVGQYCRTGRQYCCTWHPYLHIERRYRHIDVTTVGADIGASNGECFTMFYKYFMMYYECFKTFTNVLQCLVNRTTIGFATSAIARLATATSVTANHQRDRRYCRTDHR